MGSAALLSKLYHHASEARAQDPLASSCSSTLCGVTDVFRATSTADVVSEQRRREASRDPRHERRAKSYRRAGIADGLKQQQHDKN